MLAIRSIKQAKPARVLVRGFSGGVDLAALNVQREEEQFQRDYDESVKDLLAREADPTLDEYLMTQKEKLGIGTYEIRKDDDILPECQWPGRWGTLYAWASIREERSLAVEGWQGSEWVSPMFSYPKGYFESGRGGSHVARQLAKQGPGVPPILEDGTINKAKPTVFGPWPVDEQAKAVWKARQAGRNPTDHPYLAPEHAFDRTLPYPKDQAQQICDLVNGIDHSHHYPGASGHHGGDSHGGDHHGDSHHAPAKKEDHGDSHHDAHHHAKEHGKDHGEHKDHKDHHGEDHHHHHHEHAKILTQGWFTWTTFVGMWAFYFAADYITTFQIQTRKKRRARKAAKSGK